MTVLQVIIYLCMYQRPINGVKKGLRMLKFMSEINLQLMQLQ